LQSTGGKITVVVIALGAGCLAYSVIRGFLSGDTPGDPNLVTYICSETGKSFTHRVEVGESIPIQSPYSGKETGYPAEPCFWTTDGHTKTEPTWVLLNEAVHKPGPTFCPDCGRLVVGRNPLPVPGMKPPPTQAEYAARHPGYKPMPAAR
jgi:hypothetical protein